MKTIVIVQARLGSTRLPRKVVADIEGQPLLERVLRRAQRIRGVDEVVLATTELAEDRELLLLAERWNVPSFAGSAQDVLDRYYQAARTRNADVVVRVTADCPLLDPDVSGRVIERFARGDVDYASNNHPPTYPDGLDTEVFSFAALERAWREAELPSEREHVTPYIWKNGDRFSIANVADDVDRSDLRWTVDEPSDLMLLRGIYERLGGGNDFGMREILALLEREPALCGINAGFTRDEGYARSLQQDKS